MTGRFFEFASRLFENLGVTPPPGLDHLERKKIPQEVIFPSPCIQGLGWAEEQGRRPEMEDEMVAISQVDSLEDCWISAVYDGHGGRQTAEALSRRLHVNFLTCLRKRALMRWEQYRERAASRAKKLRDFVCYVEAGSFKCASRSFFMIDDFIGALRLQKILDWIAALPAPEFPTNGESRTSGWGSGGPPHYLSVCSVPDIEDSAREAFEQTDYELLQHDEITASGATACFCFVNPMIDIERILTMRPAHLKQEDWELFFPRKNSYSQDRKQSSLLRTNLTVAHVGDTRAVLVFSDGDALRLTSETDHKASDTHEVERVERLGGSVFDDRVNGYLAIGRAFGDWNLKLSYQELVASQFTGNAETGDGVVTSPADTWRQQQRDYVVSHVPHVRSVNLSEYLRKGSGRDRPSRERVDYSARKVPLALVVGCDGLFDVCTDGDVAQLCTQFIQKLGEAHPDMSPGQAGAQTARLLVEEAIRHRHSMDNVSVQVALLHPCGFSRHPPSPLCPAALPFPKKVYGHSERTFPAGSTSTRHKRSRACGMGEGWGEGSGLEGVLETFRRIFAY